MVASTTESRLRAGCAASQRPTISSEMPAACTLLKADAGSVRIFGKDLVAHPNEVRSMIGLTGQYAAVDEYLTGQENLEMIGRLYHLTRSDSRQRATTLLERFDLADAANRIAKTYSGGMRRRLDIAASLIARPRVLFLDEPTTGLDPRSRIGMWEFIGSLVSEGTTILLTTQYLEEADRLADGIVVIDQRRSPAGGSVGRAGQLRVQRPSAPCRRRSAVARAGRRRGCGRCLRPARVRGGCSPEPVAARRRAGCAEYRADHPAHYRMVGRLGRRRARAGTGVGGRDDLL